MKLAALKQAAWVLHKHWHPEHRWYARLRAAILILTGYQTEICGLCGGKVNACWHAPTPIWETVSGYEKGGVLCMRCFTNQAEATGVFLAWECSNDIRVWPSCSATPCPHEETMMVLGQQRQDGWNDLVAHCGSRDAAITFVESRRATRSFVGGTTETDT